MKRVLAVALCLLDSSVSVIPAQAANIRSLPVPVATIYPGQAITASQLTKRRFQTTASSLNGIATDAREIIGKEVRRRLPAGKPIPVSVLQVPLAVKRGATAVASYDEAGLSISMPVTILQDGASGEVIEARNMSTGAVIKVVVTARGRVQVSGE
jgi:flagella basal body P-ring formation protein FlgA